MCKWRLHEKRGRSIINSSLTYKWRNGSKPVRGGSGILQTSFVDGQWHRHLDRRSFHQSRRSKKLASFPPVPGANAIILQFDWIGRTTLCLSLGDGVDVSACSRLQAKWPERVMQCPACIARCCLWIHWAFSCILGAQEDETRYWRLLIP